MPLAVIDEARAIFEHAHLRDAFEYLRASDHPHMQLGLPRMQSAHEHLKSEHLESEHLESEHLESECMQSDLPRMQSDLRPPSLEEKVSRTLW